MSTAPTLRQEDDILTPTFRQFLRKALVWIGIVTIILVIAVVGLLFAGAVAESTEPLGPRSAAPDGTKAVVEVLTREGVDVTITAGLAETTDAIVDESATTLVVFDYQAILTEQQVSRLASLSETVVLLEPGATILNEFAPDVLQAGAVDDVELDADCQLTAAAAAGTITGGGLGYRVDGESSALCFGSGDDVYSLVRVERDDAQVTVLGATAALTNGRVVESGNAAMALTLLGGQPNLVWYVPGLDDYGDAPATIADFSPDWVVPVMITLVLVFVAVAVSQGRRFGPLVVENLPVTVRASETMHGRARLYQKSSTRLHAIDSLRIGTIDRLARLVGLPRLATVDEVVTSVAALTGRPEPAVRALLVDAVPQTDKDLLDLSDQLLVLEESAAKRLRPQ